MARNDVFLSYNRADQPVVEDLARRLVKANLGPWLDSWNLIPGAPWQEAIEEALDACASCVVCIGPSGSGTLLATLGGDIVSGDVFDLSKSTGDLNFDGAVKRFGNGEYGVAFSPDGSAFVVRYDSGRGELWDIRGTPRRLADLGVGLMKAHFVFTSQVERLAVQYGTGQLYLLDVAWLRAMGGSPGQLPEEELVRLACEGPLSSGLWTTAEQAILEGALDNRKPHSCRDH